MASPAVDSPARRPRKPARRRFTVVNYAGADPSEPPTILYILDVLAREPLDPTFERYGAFIRLAWHAVEVDRKSGRRDFTEDRPMYPAAPGALRFAGNFARISFAFSVDTDDPAVIELLAQAIATNQASAAYAVARAERRVAA